MSSSKSRNTREISDIFHYSAIHFLPERHSAMVLIYIFMDQTFFFNRTLTIDSPFQTFVVALPLLSPEMHSSSSKSRIFLCNAHLALFVLSNTIMVAQTHR